jgi:hypothetical protein
MSDTVSPTCDESDMVPQVQHPETAATIAGASSTSRGWRFWTILGSLCIACLLASVEATGMSAVYASSPTS